MKRFLSKFSLVIVLSLIIMMLPIFPSAASADEARYGKTILGKLNNSAALIYAYETLADGCKDAKSSISLQSSKHKITWDELTTVFSTVFYDYPEYFWLTGGCSGSIDGGTGAVVSVSPGYTMTGSALNAAKTSFESVSKNLLTGLTGKSDYEISLILHDRLAEHTSYVSTKNDQNAYGALVEKKAVCAGYARAYQHLMLRAGIPAWVVTGNSVNPATNNYEGHEWNVVSLDGKWYYTDVTWDDQDDTIFHAYLNLTSKQIDEDHIAVDFKNYIPNATATDANYFVKNGLVHSSFNTENVANALKKGNNTADMYVTGDVDKFKDSIASNLSSVIKAVNGNSSGGYSYSMLSLGREIILSVNIIAAGHTHKLTSVAKKAATCSSSGNTAYYTCSCGKWFSDSAAKNEITDKDSVVTKALDHSASGWKNDDTRHWKECTKCGVKIPGSESVHLDSDTNQKCDLCALTMAVAGSGTSTIVGTGNDNSPSFPAASDDTVNNGKTDNSDDNPKSEPNTVGDNDAVTSEIGSAADKSDGKKEGGATVIPIAVAAGAVVLAGAAAAIVLVKRRR